MYHFASLCSDVCDVCDPASSSAAGIWTSMLRGGFMLISRRGARGFTRTLIPAQRIMRCGCELRICHEVNGKCRHQPSGDYAMNTSILSSNRRSGPAATVALGAVALISA